MFVDRGFVMHSWVFRNRQHLMDVYAVASEDAPLENGSLMPMQPPGHVVRDAEDVVMVPMTAGAASRRLARPDRRDAGWA
jgi:hypothetical protein